MELYDYQVDHVDRLSQILEQYPIALDTSPIGAGKTWTSMFLAKKYNFSIVVIGPKTMKPVWYEVAEALDVPILNYISYQGLRSVKNKKPKHDYLYRQDIEGHGVVFSPTPTWEQITDNGILLIMDEIQMIKNKSDQYYACQALCSSILRKADYSRALLLSGSPFDKEDHAVNLLRLMGFIEHTQLSRFYKETQRLELLGVQELIDKCYAMNPERMTYLLNTYTLNHTKIANFCYRLFIDIIKPQILSQMPVPPIDALKDVKNGYYKMSEEDQKTLKYGIELLATASHYNRNTGQAQLKDADWGAVTRALQIIESSKVNILIRQALRVLEEGPGKVVIFVQFTSSIEKIAEALRDYSPLLLYGQTSVRDRGVAIDKFQNDPDARILIGNLKVGGVGISLHDTRGDQPRTMFVIPNYSLLDLHQATGRIYRQGSRSDAVIRFVYGEVNRDTQIKEVQILNALARKTKVIKEILDLHDNKISFPGDYEDEFE